MKVIDGSFIPKDPKLLLLEGKADRQVKILTTRAENQGPRFAPANITSSEDFSRFVDLYVDSAIPRIRQYITSVLYPPIFDGSLPYTTQFERASLFWAEMTSTCNPIYMHSATEGPGYYNQFSVYPSFHQGDVPYVFWNGPRSDPMVNETIANVTQSYITAFAKTGDPNTVGAPSINAYDGTKVLDMNGTNGFSEVIDVTQNSRCNWWQKAFFV